ncbi:MAG: 30S ribosomal protein S8 [Candidatus Dormibacteria bacterium]
MMTDPIADMLTRVRNANRARKADVSMPASRQKMEIARVLKDEGFIASFEVAGVGPERTLRLVFKPVERDRRVISDLKRISRPGLRIYARKTDIPRVLGGLGLVIMSTSHGVMSGREANRAGLGGEVLCYVW